MRTNNKQEKGKVRMTRGIIPPLGSWRLIGYRIRDTLLRGVIAGWMGILALALPLIAFADTTTIRSWPGGLTNYQLYSSTDVLPTPSGWNAPAAGQTQPTPSSSTATITIYETSLNNCPPSFDYVALGKCAWIAGPATGSPSDAVLTSVTWDGRNVIDWWNSPTKGPGGSDAGSAGPACPTGYALNYWKTICNLSIPTAVQKPSDGICAVITNPDGIYSPDTGGGLNGGDPDCTAAWQDAVAAVNDKMLGDACSCDKTSSTPEIGE